MKVLLIHLDGKFPNVALMRIAAHHRERGDDISLYQARRTTGIDRALLLENPELVYASCIFDSSRPLGEHLAWRRPDAVIGGTGWLVGATLEAHGIITTSQDYSIYPAFNRSIGFARRGCRLKCAFCVVPMKEGRVKQVSPAVDIWRGAPYPRELLLLDNDFFGQDEKSPTIDWQRDIGAIRAGNFKVAFSQGINARMLTSETAIALASIKCFDNEMTCRRIYTAWDNRRDEERLFAGLRYLTEAGFKPDQIMVYMLIDYWPGETEEDWLYRHDKLLAFGCRPYPMAYTKRPETLGFQRWAIRRIDRFITWPQFKEARYQSRNLDVMR